MSDINYQDAGQDFSVSQLPGLAELIATPSDVPFSEQSKHFPFMNKVMSTTNMSHDEILNIKDDLDIFKIQKKGVLRRYQKKEYDRDAFLTVRAYMEAALTNSRDGFAVKRLTSVYKNVTVSDGQGESKSPFSGIFRRGGNSE